MVKPDRQNHPHSQSSCLPSAQLLIKPLISVQEIEQFTLT